MHPEPTKRNIFLAAAGTLLRLFAGTIGIAVAILLILQFSGRSSHTPIELTQEFDGNGQMSEDENLPVIVRLNIMGVIGAGDLTTLKIATVLDELTSQAKDKHRPLQIKGLLLYINSPGGESITSDALYRLFTQFKTDLKIPIYAHVDGLCASGGMYIACAADKIYSTPTSLIGSVGVRLGPMFNYWGLMEKYGVTAKTLTEGIGKDELNEFRKWEPNEGATLQTAMDGLYQLFTDIVCETRKMDKTKLVNEYGAHIFLANEAKERKYIDEVIFTYRETLKAFAAALALQDYNVVSAQITHSIFDSLEKSNHLLKTGKMTHSFELPGEIPSELSGKLLYYYQP